MKAIRIHAFGGPDVLKLESIGEPQPLDDEILIRVRASGVGPWDAWVRSGKSMLPQPLPLTPGSDVAGTVVAVGKGVEHLRVGDAVYGATNERFTGGYAEYAVAVGNMIAKMPTTLDYVGAASVPVVATTAWQALFDYADVARGQDVLVLGAAGNVGSYVVQIAARAGAAVTAVEGPQDQIFAQELGAEASFDYRLHRIDQLPRNFDIVVDTVGGDTLAQSYCVVKSGGVVISTVAQPDDKLLSEKSVRSAFFLVKVTSDLLSRFSVLFDEGKLRSTVGEILPLRQARRAHEMLGGAPHVRGKIVLTPDG